MTDLFTQARESRDRALAIHEDRQPEWLDLAVDTIRKVAERQPTLTSDDIWGLIPEPSEPRVMGAAFVRARAEGIIDRTGLTRPSTRGTNNARHLRIWKSLAYRPNGYELHGRERKAGTLARAVLRATPDRGRSEIAEAVRSLPLDWWSGLARTLGANPPSEATILRAIEIIESEAA